MPTVSVLIPVRNTARWLAETVASVQAQTFGDWELIAIDDGSTDDSPAVLKRLAAGEPRMRVYCRENKGLVNTRNELVSLAAGTFLSWHDSDDRMSPERLALQVKKFEEEPALVWVGGACTLTDPDGLPIRTHKFPAEHEAICKIMEQEVGCYFGSTLMRHETVRRVAGSSGKPFRHPFTISEDFDLVLRMAEVGRVTNLQDVVLFYRQHMSSTVNKDRAKSYTFSRLVCQLAQERRQSGSDRLERGEPVDIDFGQLPTADQNRADTHRRWAWWALADGHLRTARKYAVHAFRAAPLERESWKLMACALRGH